jgi:hypothetical protein
MKTLKINFKMTTVIQVTVIYTQWEIQTLIHQEMKMMRSFLEYKMVKSIISVEKLYNSKYGRLK